MKRILLSLLVFALIFAGIQGAAAQDSDECNATLTRSEEINISVPATLDFGNLTVGPTHEKMLNVDLNVSSGKAWTVTAQANKMNSSCGNYTLTDAIDVSGNFINIAQEVDSGGEDDTADAFDVTFNQAIYWADRVAEYSTVITFSAGVL